MPGASSVGLAKLIANGAVGGLAVSLLAAASEIPLPMSLPEPHTTTEAVLALVGLAIWREQRQQRVAPPPPPPTRDDSDSGSARSEWRENLMGKLEEMAFGNRESAKEVKDFRLEFSDFRGETRGRLEGIEGRVTRVEHTLEKNK